MNKTGKSDSSARIAAADTANGHGALQPFDGVFTQQEPIPEEAIENAVTVMRSGRLHRYNTVANQESETSKLEKEFASYLGVAHCLACASGGYAMQLALRAAGLEPDEPVLTNAFTLSPVPGSIRAAGGRPLLVETTRELVIDLEHLQSTLHEYQSIAGASSPRVLLLSHMRGHIVDMEALMQIVEQHKLVLIEDCAHTMGASWNGKKCGTFGAMACFSTQTYKHINSGEGGLLTTNSPDIAARAILNSGSYMLYERNGTAPEEAWFAETKYDIPNCSGRMDELRATILRPQLGILPKNCERWNQRYQALAAVLTDSALIELPHRPEKEGFVASSLQFLVPGITPEKAQEFQTTLGALNVELKWFGNPKPVGFTSHYSSWAYVNPPSLPATDAVLGELFDLRLPLTFSLHDCKQIGRLITQSLERLTGG